MKTSIIMLIFCLFAVVAIGQTTKGSFSLGGSVSLSSSKGGGGTTDGEEKITKIGLSPTAGYFMADGMELGLKLSYTSTDVDDEVNDYQYKNTSTSLGPYFKYYIFTSNENFAFTLNASLLFGSTKYSPEEGDGSKGTSLYFGIAPGFSYFFTEKIGLDFELEGISYSSQDPNSDADNDNTSTFTFGLSSLSPSLGFKYYFAR